MFVLMKFGAPSFLFVGPLGFKWERNVCYLVQAQTSSRYLPFSSHADITPSSISRSNSLGGSLDTPSAHHNWPHSLQEHLSGSTSTSTVDKDQSISPCTAGSISSRISEKSPAVSRALQELMLSEDEVSHGVFFKFDITAWWCWIITHENPCHTSMSVSPKLSVLKQLCNHIFQSV